MRNSFQFYCLIFFIASCTQTADLASEEYSIRGTVENFEPQHEIVLHRFDPITQVKQPLDTAKITEDGAYELALHFDRPDLFRVDFPNRQSVMLVIDEGQTAITLNVEGNRNGTVEIKGSPDSEKLLGYDAFRMESNARLVKPPYAAMRAATKAGDTQAEIDAVEAYVTNNKLHRTELIDYTEREIGTSIALFGTVLRWTGDDNADRLERLVAKFAEVHPDLNMTEVMQDKVARYTRVAVGAAAPPLVAARPDGREASLTELGGKYTLIDFWASWCGPCILQIPDLQQAYHTYNEMGFEIVSVSVDRKEEKWKEALEKYDMPWPQISDVKGWESELAAAYNVTFVPFNLLIDENGVIIAKNLHSKVLHKQLASLFEES